MAASILLGIDPAQQQAMQESGSTAATPRTNHVARAAALEQQVKMLRRECNRWRRHSAESDARYDSERMQSIQLLLQRQSSLSEQCSWWTRLIEQHGQRFNTLIIARGDVESRMAQIKTQREFEAQLSQSLDATARSTDDIVRQAQAAMSQQRTVVQQAWMKDLHNLIHTFEEVDELLDTHQSNRYRWQSDLRLADQFARHHSSSGQADQQSDSDRHAVQKLTDLIAVCEKPLLIMSHLISLLERQLINEQCL
jgi:hypothetical protein